MACFGRVMRGALLAAVTLSVSPSAYAQQNPTLPGVRTIALEGRAVRVQALGLQDRRPGAPVVVFDSSSTLSDREMSERGEFPNVSYVWVVRPVKCSVTSIE